jgi:hypothetical protein
MSSWVLCGKSDHRDFVPEKSIKNKKIKNKNKNLWMSN